MLRLCLKTNRSGEGKMTKTLTREELINWIEKEDLPLIMRATLIDEDTVLLQKIKKK